MKKLIVCALTMTILLGGCNSAKQLPREVAIVPDVSASIDPEARRQMFAAIEDVAQHLQRGDTLTIIPITGDAEAELQGRTLHYVVPPVEDRQAYDADLRRLTAQIKADLDRLLAAAIAHPGRQTDILGSVRVATKEFSSATMDRRLIILSDFIQDDDQFNFANDRRIGTVPNALMLAKMSSKDIEIPPSTTITMGRLQSSEYSRLPLKRRQAVDAFWTSLFSPATITPDGIVALRGALSENRSHD